MRCRQLGIQGFVLKPKGGWFLGSGGLNAIWQKKGNPNRDEFLGTTVGTVQKLKKGFQRFAGQNSKCLFLNSRFGQGMTPQGNVLSKWFWILVLSIQVSAKKAQKLGLGLCQNPAAKWISTQKNRHWRWVKDGKGDLWVVYLEVQDTYSSKWIVTRVITSISGLWVICPLTRVISLHITSY